MFGVTILTDLRRTPLRGHLIRRGCVVSEIHHSVFPGSLSLAAGMTTDIVTCFPFPDSQYRDGVLTLSRSRAIQRELRQLPHDVCMGDGRKWRSVPFLPLIDEREIYSAFVDTQISSGGVYSYMDDADAYRVIKEAVDGYKRRVVNEFDNMGFLVTERNGRLQVGPALGGKRDLENEYYNGAADRIHKKILSHHLRFPKLAVLMGRMPKGSGVEQLELAQSREPFVKIITYDEILDFQRNLLN